MNLSGIVVTAPPARLAEVVQRIESLPGLEIAAMDEAAGRLVVLQERQTVGAEMDGLRAIQRLPDVISADLVVHYFGDDEQPAALTAQDLALRLEQEGAARPLPASNPD